MRKYFRIMVGIFVGLLISSCAIFKKRIDPEIAYTTDSGFRFKFAMPGEWYPGPGAQGQYVVGQNAADSGSSKLALVKHGPVFTNNGAAASNSEILASFKKNIEAESKGGRVNKVSNEFTQKKFKGADCLFFQQTGEDAGAAAPMTIRNDGLVCLNPKRKYNYIWMAISERNPVTQPPSQTLTKDKQSLFESLEFVD